MDKAKNFEISFDFKLGIGKDRVICTHKSSDGTRRDLCCMESALSAFSDYLVREGKSPTTIRKYTKDLRQFSQANYVRCLDDITRERINAWTLTLRNRERSVGTIANHLWAIKAFLLFIKNEMRISAYEFDIKIPYVKPPTSVVYLKIEELEKLFSVLDITDIRDLRLRTLIEVMLNTGLRPSEALNLKRAALKSEPAEIEIIGKGGKTRMVYLNDRAYIWINQYLAKRKSALPELFVTHRIPSRPLTLRSAEDCLQKAVEKCAFGKRVGLHTLRHTYATHLMANGCPPDYVARLLGHSKVETTRRYYLAIVQKHAREAHFRFLDFSEKDTDTDKAIEKPLPELNAPIMP